MKEPAEKMFRAWLFASLEEIQQMLDAIATVQELETDDMKELRHIGAVMIDEKKRQAQPKVGRPRGSKTRKEASGNGE